MIRVTKRITDDGYAGLAFRGHIPNLDNVEYKSCPVKKGMSTFKLERGMEEIHVHSYQ